ncbi:hypothetical protein OROGR_009249 [Orobanche gracilis]
MMDFNDVDFLIKLRDALCNITEQHEQRGEYPHDLLRYLPEFKGTSNPSKYLDWIHKCEETFDVRKVPINRRVSLATKLLRGRAATWWQRIKSTRKRLGKPKICDSQSNSALERHSSQCQFPTMITPIPYHQSTLPVASTEFCKDKYIEDFPVVRIEDEEDGADFAPTISEEKNIHTLLFDEEEEDIHNPFFDEEDEESGGWSQTADTSNEPVDIKTESVSYYVGPPIFDEEVVDEEEKKIYFSCSTVQSEENTVSSGFIRWIATKFGQRQANSWHYNLNGGDQNLTSIDWSRLVFRREADF